MEHFDNYDKPRTFVCPGCVHPGNRRDRDTCPLCGRSMREVNDFAQWENETPAPRPADPT